MKYYNERFGFIGMIGALALIWVFILTGNYWVGIPWFIFLIMVQAGYSWWGIETLNPWLHELFHGKPWRIRFTCWFSKKYWDIHDYKKNKGGDGIPTHFYTYNCWNCDKEFDI